MIPEGNPGFIQALRFQVSHGQNWMTRVGVTLPLTAQMMLHDSAEMNQPITQVNNKPVTPAPAAAAGA